MCKDKEREKLCQGECGAVLESGFFKHVKDGDLIKWEFNINGTNINKR
jgi:hypothetical protein